MSTKTSDKKRNTGFSQEKLEKFVEGKAMGLSNAEAKKVAGYHPSTNPLKSVTAQLTMAEKFAQKGMGDDWYIDKLKSAAEAEKVVPLGQGESTVDADWTNRVKALELYAKSTDKLSPIKTRTDINVNLNNPLAALSDEELKRLIRSDEEDDRFIIDVTPEEGN